jgi:hypothetical protein
MVSTTYNTNIRTVMTLGLEKELGIVFLPDVQRWGSPRSRCGTPGATT